MRKNLLLKALGGIAVVALIASFADVRDSAANDCEFITFIYKRTVEACNAGHTDACRLLPAHEKYYDRCPVAAKSAERVETIGPPPPNDDKPDLAQKEEEKKEEQCAKGLTAKDKAVFQRIAKMDGIAKANQKLIAWAPLASVLSGDPIEVAITAFSTDASLHVEAMMAIDTIKACSIADVIELHLLDIDDESECRVNLFEKIQGLYIKRCSDG